MSVRAALLFLVLGFIGVLIVLGAVSFARWLKLSSPRHYRLVLATLCVMGVGLGILVYMEGSDRPVFHPGDLITLGQPLVARIVEAERNVPTTSCIVEIREHLSVVEVRGGALKASVESNRTSGPRFCPLGAEVQFDLAWLKRYTLTHR